MYFNEKVDEIYQFLEEDIVSKFNLINSKPNANGEIQNMKQVVCTIVGFSKFYESLNPTKKKNFSFLLCIMSLLTNYFFF